MAKAIVKSGPLSKRSNKDSKKSASPLPKVATLPRLFCAVDVEVVHQDTVLRHKYSRVGGWVVNLRQFGRIISYYVFDDRPTAMEHARKIIHTWAGGPYRLY